MGKLRVPISAEQIRNARNLAISDLRDLAKKQITGAKMALSAAQGTKSPVLGISWDNIEAIPVVKLISEGADYLRWKPFVSIIEDSEESFKRAESEIDTAKKKESYISSWSNAYIAVKKIEEESKSGKTSFLFEADKAIVEPVVETASKVAKKAEEYATSAASSIAETAMILAIVYVAFNAFGSGISKGVSNGR